MTAYNVEDLVKTSVMSILNQNYRNLELIVVDDCSTDGTLEALRPLENQHQRMRVISKDRNDGTYVSKNTGLLWANGKYVTFQDSDDWSHPDRLGKSVAVLQKRPDIVALTTSYVRMTNEGNLVLQRSGHYSLKAYISLTLRWDDVVRRSGYFDSVRAAADTELERRICMQFGESRVVHFSWPLYFGRMRAESITAHSEYGMAWGRAKPVRERYRKAYIKWHSEIGKRHDGYMPFPLRERPFAVPRAIQPQPQ